jgi:glutamate racemase
VPLVEEGWSDSGVAEAIARHYLAPLAAKGIDTLVLGCTHYPLLRGVLQRVANDIAGREIAVVDSASAMAEAAREALGSGPNKRQQPGRLDCFATDTSRLEELAPRFLGEPITGFELVDL